MGSTSYKVQFLDLQVTARRNGLSLTTDSNGFFVLRLRSDDTLMARAATIDGIEAALADLIAHPAMDRERAIADLLYPQRAHGESNDSPIAKPEAIQPGAALIYNARSVNVGDTVVVFDGAIKLRKVVASSTELGMTTLTLQEGELPGTQTMTVPSMARIPVVSDGY